MLFFIMFSVVIAISCSAITIKTLVGYTDLSVFIKAFVTIIITVSWFAPIIVTAIKKAYSDTYVLAYSTNILYFMFGAAFIIFVTLITRDFFWYLSFYAAKLTGHEGLIVNPKNLIWLSRTNIVIVIFSVLISFYALYEGIKPPRIKTVELTSPKIYKDFNIVLATDLHIHQTTPIERVKNTVERINALNPDIIVLGGDVIDDSLSVLEKKVDVLKDLSARYGTYIVYGNHELYSGLLPWTNKFLNMGENIKLLSNQTVTIDDENVSLIGIPDKVFYNASKAFMPNFEMLLKNIPDNNYKILLSHSPEIVDTLVSGDFDLQLSGHTHGGQIFPFHIPVKLQNGYLAGLYDVKGTKLYVSRGAGFWGPPLRLFAPSEITYIRIKPEND